jgi:uncharacterized BrkB/YihY/UPF0761 family membrane protein
MQLVYVLLIGGFMSISDKIALKIADVQNVYARRVLAVFTYFVMAIVIVIGLSLQLAVDIVVAAWDEIRSNYKANDHLLSDFIRSFKELW